VIAAVHVLALLYVHTVMRWPMPCAHTLSGVCGMVSGAAQHQSKVGNVSAAAVQVTGSKSEISYQENTTDDPKQRKPDITKAQTNLGWEPRVPLKKGLQLMIDDFTTRLGLKPSAKGAAALAENGKTNGKTV
jgi:UDP-glucose 4-epimerase